MVGTAWRGRRAGPRRPGRRCPDGAHRRTAPRSLDAAGSAQRLVQEVVAQADGRAQSGTETIARYLLRAAGLHVEPQAQIAGMGHADLLVEGRVLVELDGRERHDDDAFEEDRRRDLVATVGRYRVLRFGWYRVLFRWHEVEAAIFAALAM